MKAISTKTHGYLDLMTVGALLAVPRARKWDPGLTRTLSRAALGMLGYSLMTRYEFGLVKVLPMRGHLALDALSGAALCGTPLLFPDVDSKIKGGLVGMGLFEIAAALTTQTEPSGEEIGREAVERATELGHSIGRVAAGTDGLGSRIGGAIRSLVGQLG